MNKKIKFSQSPKAANSSKEYYSFSFAYLSEDSQYGIGYFGNKKSKDGFLMYQDLMRKVKCISQTPIIDILDMDKSAGLEQISIKYFSTAIQHLHQIMEKQERIQNTQKLIIFRFGKQRYRMICTKDENNHNLLYILAFDFDYSAYNHG